MPELTIDYLYSISIPQFKEEIGNLKKKYNYPQTICYSSGCPIPNIPAITDAFYNDVMILKDNIIQFLKKEFPIEINNIKLFNNSLSRNVGSSWHYPQGISCTSIESYVMCFCSPPCGGSGYYGCDCSQYSGDRKIFGVNGIDRALSLAYNICVDAKENRIAKELKDNNDEELKKKDEEQRIYLEKLKIRKYEKLLYESLSMHYFPQRVVKGIRRPAEWLPDFDLDLIKEIRKTFSSSVAQKIIEKVTIVTKPNKDKMIAKYLQDKEKKKIQEEERKARILAKAIILAQVEADNNGGNASIAGDPSN
jgi:hypothetical protein